MKRQKVMRLQPIYLEVYCTALLDSGLRENKTKVSSKPTTLFCKPSQFSSSAKMYPIDRCPTKSLTLMNTCGKNGYLIMLNNINHIVGNHRAA